MITVDLKQAATQLGSLIDEAAAGEHVVIDAGRCRVRLVSVPRDFTDEATATTPIGHQLDRYLGTWSAQQEAELLAAVEVFDKVDESFWS